MNNKPINIRIKKILPFVLISAVIAVFVIWFIPSKVFPISWDFRNNLWGPANLLVQHRSPYNIHVIFTGSNAIWMPVIIGALFPIGFLPEQWASNLWLLMNLISLGVLVILLSGTSKRSLIWILLTFIFLAVFPPTMTHFVLGQVSILICLILIVLVKYRDRLNPVVSGLILTLSLTKPQLVVLFIPAFLVIYFREQRRHFVLLMLSSLIWIVILCTPLFLFYPRWIPDLLLNLSNNPTWFYPTLYSYILSSTGSFGVSLASAGIWLLIGVVLALVLTFKLDGFESLLWCLAITPLFSPFVWSWDFVFLFPLIIFMVFKKKSRASSWVLYCGYGICTLIYIFMKIHGWVEDQSAFWVPPFMLLILFLCRMLQGRNILSNPDQIQNIVP